MCLEHQKQQRHAKPERQSEARATEQRLGSYGLKAHLPLPLRILSITYVVSLLELWECSGRCSPRMREASAIGPNTASRLAFPSWRAWLTFGESHQSLAPGKLGRIGGENS